MSKPTAADYRSALQNPQFAFKGTELETAVAAKDHLGLPKMATGNFAAVCEMRSGSKRWAVRCFLRDVPQIESRSKTVADFVGGYLDQIPSLVSTKFVANGINVLNKHYPIVVMDWVEGIPLDSWIDSQIKKGQPLHQVLNGWLQMIADLERIGAAHGDLQHGNVLVAGDRLRLVDYDGMFVPVTNCPKPNEIGHPNYQAPSRTITRFDSYVDRFSSLLVSTAIYSLTLHPALWHECSMPDDAILFRRSDLEHPERSALFSRLSRIEDATLKLMIAQLRKALAEKSTPPSVASLLAQLGVDRPEQQQISSSNSAQSQSSSSHSDWWKSSESPPVTPPSSIGNAELEPSTWWQKLFRKGIGKLSGLTESAEINPVQTTTLSEWYKSSTSSHVQTGTVNPQQQGLPGWVKLPSTDKLRPNHSTQLSMAQKYVSSSNSRLYHTTKCKWSARIAQTNLITHDSEADALAAGLSPCRVCISTTSGQPRYPDSAGDRPNQSTSRHSRLDSPEKGNSSSSKSSSGLTRNDQVPLARRTKDFSIVHPGWTTIDVVKGVGDVVTVLDKRSGWNFKFRLVIEPTMHAGSGLTEVSTKSPMGVAIIGKRRGDTFSFAKDGTVFEYVIQHVANA